FGDPEFNIPIKESAGSAGEECYWTFKRILSSVSTLIPLLGMLGFCVAFNFTKRDAVLLWLQRRSFLIGLLTTVPFAVIPILYSSGGKFLGATTPWEPVKITFLLSYAGILG